MTTGYVYHPVYSEHNLPGHPECRERLQAILRALEAAPFFAKLTPIEPSPVSIGLLEQVHSPDYVSLVEKAAEGGGGHLDVDTYLGPRSYQAALMAAGGVVEATRAVLSGKVENAFALVRPPGHHATPTLGMGFCLFNNIAIAAEHALSQGLERVMIVDFDVHHGNGTQDAFYHRKDVLYFSTHQYPLYPGTGALDDTGWREGLGFTVNLPLPPGVGDEGYKRAFDQILCPLARRYSPQIILVSAGYDAHWADPLANMCLSTTGYHHLVRALKETSESLCQGRLVLTLEGGYDLRALSTSVLATFAALMDEEPCDPLGPGSGSETSVDQLLDRAKAIHNLSQD